MELQTLKVGKREGTGSGPAGRMRRAGSFPGILYGGGQDPVGLQLDLREFSRLVHGRGGEHAIVQLEVADYPSLGGPAMLKQVQHHPVRGQVIHADFQRIRLDERITTLVPVVLVGRSPGVAEGGVLDQMLREIEVECRALEVPAELSVDVSALGMGDSIRVAAVTAPENVTIVTDPDRTVVAIHAPRAVVEAEAAAEGETAEPEVIGQKKAEDEE